MHMYLVSNDVSNFKSDKKNMQIIHIEYKEVL